MTQEAAVAERSGAWEVAKRLLKRRPIRLLLALVLSVVIVPFALLPLMRVVDPPVTALQIWKRIEGRSIIRDAVPLEAVSPSLVRAVVTSEDARFCLHNGIDMQEVEVVLEDWRAGEEPRGASTITMQLIKNLFLWPERSYARKAIEVPLALYAELVLPKRRILELYLNSVEWAPGVYGAEAAARHHFGRAAADLDAAQGALLAAALPNPDERDPARPGPHQRKLARVIERRAGASDPYLTCIAD